ncbi:MAG TPA: sigma-70 family RNA polymerase sigma factor [Blastocatellia bacterium]|nr:sigma-70 family RNA polymerase sigma factor [Blastocatellia bacterium]
MATGKKDWELTQEVFDKLLAQFDSDHDRAGEKYEAVRKGIMKFFECRGCLSPQDLADETINRVAHKIAKGEKIHEGALVGYFYGVARNVFREHLRNPVRNSSSLDSIAQFQHPFEDPIEIFEIRSEQFLLEQRLRCLESCVKKLPDEARGLIISYYEGEVGAKIENRRRLAGVFNLTPNSLRIRVHRIREKLEDCVRTCVQKSSDR